MWLASCVFETLN